MNIKLLGIGLGAALAASSLAGCKNCFRGHCPAPCPPAGYSSSINTRPPSLGYLPSHSLTPSEGTPVAPPPSGAGYGYPHAPAGPAYGPPPGSQTPAPALAPAYAPPNGNAWQPAPDNTRLKVPEGISSEAPRQLPASPDSSGQGSVRLYPPDKMPPASDKPAPAIREEIKPMPNVNDSQTRAPAGAENRFASPSLPVGIPQFAVAMDNVTAGLKPSLEGLDWLKERGYKTVLHLRAPGEENAGDRAQIERRGMKYQTMEISAENLNKQVVDDFNRFVADRGNQPLFIYDRDGSRVGGLWYLYFRTVELQTDDVARTRAGRLGLKEDQDGDHRTMMLAIQKFLSDRPR